MDLMGESKEREMTALCYLGYILRNITQIWSIARQEAKLGQMEGEGEGKKAEVVGSMVS